MTSVCNIPQLETERLILRAPTAQEFEPYCVLSTSDRAQYMGKLDRDTAWKAYAAELGHWPLFGFGPFHLERKTDGAVLGNVGILNHDTYPETELGWSLYEGFEGLGYAAEAAVAVRNWAFDACKLSTLVSYIDPDNARSIALAERLGATLDPDAQGEDPTDLVYRHQSGCEVMQ